LLANTAIFDAKIVCCVIWGFEHLISSFL